MTTSGRLDKRDVSEANKGGGGVQASTSCSLAFKVCMKAFSRGGGGAAAS